jgi:hypothetical protein
VTDHAEPTKVNLNRDVPAQAIVDLIAGKTTVSQLSAEYATTDARIESLRDAALNAIGSTVQKEQSQNSKSRRLTQWLKAAVAIALLAATILILCNEFQGEIAWLRDADRRLIAYVASLNPFMLVVLFFKGVGDYFQGCPAVPSSNCPNATAGASPLTAIGHGFEYIAAQTPDVPLKGLLIAAAVIASWFIGARMAKSSGDSMNFFWIVPGLVGLSVICFLVQAVLWLAASSVFVVLATLALVGGSLSVLALIALKAVTTVSEGKKAIEITKALVSHHEVEV